MINEKNLFNLNEKFKIKKSCFFKYLSILSAPLIMFALIVLSYLNYISLKMEIHTLILTGIIFLIFVFFAKHNARIASCRFKKSFEDFKTNLLSYVNKNQVNIDQTSKVKGNIDDFLNDYTSTLRNGNFSSVAAGVFPTLGILGTFISIALTMPDFSSKTSAVLEQEISILLSGVGTAFYVSIYGIFLSLWWIFFEKLGLSVFDRDIQIIKETTKDLFWSDIDMEKIQFQKSIENFEKLNTLFSQMNQTDLEVSLSRSMEKKAALFDNMIEQESIFLEQSKIFHQSMELKHNQLLNSYENIVQQLQSYTPALEEALRHTTLITKHFNKQERDLLEISKNLNENISKLSNSLESIRPDILKDLSNQMVKNLEVMRNDTDRIGWRLNKQLDEFDTKLNEKISGTLNNKE